VIENIGSSTEAKKMHPHQPRGSSKKIDLEKSEPSVKEIFFFLHKENTQLHLVH